MARKGYRIAEVALRVDDLEGTAAFYQEVLGFAFHKREETVIFLEVGPLDSPLGAGWPSATVRAVPPARAGDRPGAERVRPHRLRGAAR